MTDAEVHEWVIDGQRQMSRMVAFNATMLTQWESRRVWANDGSRSPGARLAREANMSKESADRAISRARNLRQMPHTAAALASGDLSVDHVDLLARANSGCRTGFFTDHEETLVEQCKVLRFADCRRMVEYWRQHADTTPAATPTTMSAPHERRTASAAKTLDGTIDLRALLDPVGGAAFVAELERLERLLYLEDQRSGNERSTGQRRADALVEMAHRSRTAREGGLRPRPLITVLVGEDSFKHLCELSTGTVIKPGQIVPWLSDADIEAVLFEGGRG